MKKLLFLFSLFIICSSLQAQDETCSLEFPEPTRYNIWNPDNQPNSRLQGKDLPADSIARQRIWRCGIPRLYAYQPVVEERSRTAIIIIPGGGYIKQAYEVSGISMAKWFNTMGVTAFVLLHRLPNQQELIDPWRATMQDCQRAVKWVRSHAAEFGIDADCIGVMGTSAGAHLSACVSTLSEDWAQVGDSLDDVSPRPDFAICVSPIINEVDPLTAGKRMDLCGATMDDPAWRKLFSIDQSVTSANPPTLLIHAANDPAVPVYNSIRMFEALQKAGAQDCSLHIFPQGKHNIALRQQPGTTALWTEIAEGWLRELELIRYNSK